MKLRVCKLHKEYKYSLKSSCLECKKPTQDAHYKFLKFDNEGPKN